MLVLLKNKFDYNTKPEQNDYNQDGKLFVK